MVVGLHIVMTDVAALGDYALHVAFGTLPCSRGSKFSVCIILYVVHDIRQRSERKNDKVIAQNLVPMYGTFDSFSNRHRIVRSFFLTASDVPRELHMS